jgi:hypothetical protein
MEVYLHADVRLGQRVPELSLIGIQLSKIHKSRGLRLTATISIVTPPTTFIGFETVSPAVQLRIN